MGALMGLRTALGLKRTKVRTPLSRVVPPISVDERPPPRNEIDCSKASAKAYVRPLEYSEPIDVNDVYGNHFHRRGDIAQLVKPDGIGIELGVARGWLSERLLASGNFHHLYSVDRWDGDRGHDVEEYKVAIRALMPYRDKNTCLKMSFDEALDLFADEYFDFIYIDGYAHTGQEGGKTLENWWPKLKPGGLFTPKIFPKPCEL